MPDVTISPPPKFSSSDILGAPLVGGLLYTYLAGTSTPYATYTDQTGTIANANPVVLDARGEANVWLEQGVAYKFALHDALNNLIWTVDNINAAPGGGATGLFGNGTVSAPSISFLNSTGMGFYRISNNVLGVATAGANAIAIDASQNVGIDMPKMKTKRGAAKRFRVRASGSIKRARANLRHILTKKAQKRKRQLRGTTAVVAADTAAVRAMMPYAK